MFTFLILQNPVPRRSFLCATAECWDHELAYMRVFQLSRRHTSMPQFESTLVPAIKKGLISLVADAGTDCGEFRSTRVGDRTLKRGQLLETIRMRYQATSWLKMKHILVPTNPEHVRLFPTLFAEELAGRDPHAAVVVKAEPRVPRRPRAETVEVCDLTGDDVQWLADEREGASKRVQLSPSPYDATAVQ